MVKTKIVLDTNILVSSVGWEGNPRRIFEKIVKKELELVMSIEQFYELCRVLDYPKFDFSEEQKNKFKNLILETASFFASKEKVVVINEDPDDNMILESALAGGADYIVTGDSHLLKLKEFRRVKIVDAKAFLEKL